MSELIDKPLEYDRLADEYYQTLPLEHFMESMGHAEQRRIAWESLSLLHARRPEVQVFNETLIQYRVMVRVWTGPPTTKKSYNIELEPVGPLWVLEWFSSSSEGKDYGDAFRSMSAI